MDGHEVLRETIVRVAEGELTDVGSWVYVWVKAGTIVYVGATGLPPEVRTWLHLHHEDPAIGRVRAEHPAALEGQVEIHAYQLDPSVDRQAVRRALTELLNDDEVPIGDDSEGPAFAAAREIVQRLPR